MYCNYALRLHNYSTHVAVFLKKLCTEAMKHHVHQTRLHGFLARHPPVASTQAGRCLAQEGAGGARAPPRGRSPTPTPQAAPRGAPAAGAAGASLFLPTAKHPARALGAGPRAPGGAVQRPAGAPRGALPATLTPLGQVQGPRIHLCCNPLVAASQESGMRLVHLSAQAGPPSRGRPQPRSGSPAGEAGGANPAVSPRLGDPGAAVAAAMQAGDEAAADAAAAAAVAACLDNPLNPNRRARGKSAAQLRLQTLLSSI